MIDTWAAGSNFEYDGCVLTGTCIRYGVGNSITVTTANYDALRRAFLGKVVLVNAGRTGARQGSLGDWLLQNVTRTAIASYIAPILIREGYAIREDEHSIRIVR